MSRDLVGGGGDWKHMRGCVQGCYVRTRHTMWVGSRQPCVCMVWLVILVVVPSDYVMYTYAAGVRTWQGTAQHLVIWQRFFSTFLNVTEAPSPASSCRKAASLTASNRDKQAY